MEKLLTEKELCEFLGLGRTTLYRLRKKGLPFVSVGRQIRYDKEEVLKWLEENKK